jgi:hypothetical protein
MGALVAFEDAASAGGAGGVWAKSGNAAKKRQRNGSRWFERSSMIVS